MPRLRHSLGWNSSVDAVEASKKPQNEQEDTSDGVVDEEQGSFHVLRETLSEHVIRHIAASSKSSQATARSRKKGGKNASSEEHGDLHDKTDAQGIDVQELQEFIEYLASEIYDGLPEPVRTLNHFVIANDSRLAGTYSDPVPKETLERLVVTTPVAVTDSLTAYGLLEGPPGLKASASPLEDFLADVYAGYITALTTDPDRSVHESTPQKPSECELCGREWIILTVHHLIPRETWPKAVKRGWIANEEEGHRRIAWICRACHNLVHKIASNEELARHYNSVELLEEREDVQKFVAWVGRVRWKKK